MRLCARLGGLGLWLLGPTFSCAPKTRFAFFNQANTIERWVWDFTMRKASEGMHFRNESEYYLGILLLVQPCCALLQRTTLWHDSWTEGHANLRSLVTHVAESCRPRRCNGDACALAEWLLHQE